MKSSFKSFIKSFIVVLIYYFASLGIIRLFRRRGGRSADNARAMLMVYTLFISTLTILITTYELLPESIVDPIYYGLIIFHAAYLFFGGMLYVLSGE